MRAFLYKLTFGDGLVYIGYTTNPIKKRVNIHRCHANSSTSKYRDYPVYRAWRLYGEPSVEIICEGDKDYIIDLEFRMISALDCIWPKGYNQVAGGNKANRSGATLSEETRRKLSEKAKLRVGRVHSEATRAKISASKKGVKRIIDQNTRAVMVANSLATKARKKECKDENS